MIVTVGVLAPFGVAVTDGGISVEIKYAYAEEHLLKCGWTNVTCLFANLSLMVLDAFAFFLGLAGILLDSAVETTVLKMGSSIGNVAAISEAWGIFRDVANIVLIFTLLAIGFGTILRISGFGMKELLAKVIIIALLINFSLFFTKVIIDTGNLLAIQFYNQIKTEECAVASIVGGKGCSISGQFMNALSLTTLYKTDSTGTTTASLGVNVEGKVNYGNIITIGLMGSLLFLVTTFVFLAGAFLLIARFVILIFLMILSPLAFAAMILPITSEHAKKWWRALINYTIFAPIYFLLIFVVLKIIGSDSFKTAIGLKDGDAFGALTTNTGGDIGALSIVLNFLIVIGFMIASIVIAKQLGIAGSEAVIKAGQNARKWGQGVIGTAAVGGAAAALRTSFGRGASRLAESDTLKKAEARGGIAGALGGGALRGLRGVAGSSFDARATAAGKALSKTDSTLGKAGGKGGYDQKLKDQIKERVKRAEVIGKASETKEQGEEKAKAQINLAEAQKALAPLQEKVREAKTAHKANPTPDSMVTLEQAETLAKPVLQTITLESGKIQNVETAVRARGEQRKAQYAQTLETEKTLDTLFIKVPRKNKEGAAAIRKGKSNAQKIQDAVKEGLKDDKDFKDSLKPEDEG